MAGMDLNKKLPPGSTAHSSRMGGIVDKMIRKKRASPGAGFGMGRTVTDKEIDAADAKGWTVAQQREQDAYASGDASYRAVTAMDEKRIERHRKKKSMGASAGDIGPGEGR